MFTQTIFSVGEVMYVFPALAFTLLAVLCMKEVQKRRKYRYIKQKLPTAFGVPLLGITYSWMPLTNFFSSFDFYFNKFQSHSFCTWFGSNAFIVTADPDIVKIVLSGKQFLNKSTSVYKPVDNALHNGIITSKGTKWKHNRKLMNSWLTHTTLKSFLPIFHRGTATVIRKLNELVGKEEQDVFSIVKRLVLRIALETTMGVTMHERSEVNEKLSSSFNYIIQKIAEDAMLSVVSLGFCVRSKKYYKTLEFLKDYVYNLVIQNLKAKDANNNEQISSKNNKNSNMGNEVFIERAYKFYEGGQFQLEDVITESQTIIVGSFETVSTTLYSVLVLLSMHPYIQEKLFEEIKLILPTTNDNMEYEHLKSIPYLDMVIDETLRLMPSIPFIARDVSKDTFINDMFVPKGFQIAIPIFNLHRRRDIWGKKADYFNPENFLPDNISQRHPYSYIPFSKGPRNCIGMRYARLALRVLLLGILRNYKFSTSFKYNDLRFVEHVSLRYEKEPLLKVQKRE